MTILILLNIFALWRAIKVYLGNGAGRLGITENLPAKLGTLQQGGIIA